MKVISIIIGREEMRSFYAILKRVGQEESRHYGRDTIMLGSIEVWKSLLSMKYSEFEDANEFCLIFVDSEIDLLYNILMLCNSREVGSGSVDIKSKIMHYIEQYRFDQEYIFTPCEVPF